MLRDKSFIKSAVLSVLAMGGRLTVLSGWDVPGVGVDLGDEG
jgi:hypothetical protein